MGLRKYLESENAGREMKILETRRRDTVGEASLLKWPRAGPHLSAVPAMEALAGSGLKLDPKFWGRRTQWWALWVTWAFRVDRWWGTKVPEQRAQFKWCSFQATFFYILVPAPKLGVGILLCDPYLAFISIIISVCLSNPLELKVNRGRACVFVHFWVPRLYHGTWHTLSTKKVRICYTVKWRQKQ